jgi:hypothetical protein
MEYITKSTFKKIFSTFKITEIESKIHFTNFIDFNFDLIEKMNSFFKDSESIIISCFHKPCNKYSLNSFDEDIVYGTYHSKKDCKILLSDYKSIKVPSELIENIIDQNKKIGKSDDEIKTILFNEILKFKNIVKKHFPYLKDIKPSNTEFENEIKEIWGMENFLEIIFNRNSGYVNIENLNLLDLDTEIKSIINKISIHLVSELSCDEILLIIFNLFVSKVKLEYTNIAFEKYEDKILRYFKSTIEESNFDFKYFFIQYFSIIFNKSIPFESNLFTHLNLKFCLGDCGVEIYNDILEIILEQQKKATS